MSHSTTPPACVIGCDVGKHVIAVFDSGAGARADLPNDPAALAAFAAALPAGCLVVCEATGGYEAALLDAVLRAGHAAHRADARRVKAFIRSLGTLAKTDALDARALARYGHERHDRLARWSPRAAERALLATLVATRTDLVRARVALLNRAQAPAAAPVADALRTLVAHHDAAIDGIAARIATLIETTPQLATATAVLRAIPGIGATTAAALLALLPELGTIDRKAIASLAGLAPHPRQSGASDAYRRTRGGRPEVKRTLFMATMAAVRHNPVIASFYKRLRDNGKKPILALTAAMRKLLTIANAKLRDTIAPQLS